MSRFPIAMTAVTLGALAVGAAAMIGAFAVIDQRAAQILKTEPRVVPGVQKRASSADAGSNNLRGGTSRTARGSAGSRIGPPAPTRAETIGSAAAISSVAAPSQGAQQAMTGDARRVPDTVRGSDRKVRADGHDRTTRHGRASARRPAQESPPQLPPPSPPQQPQQDGSRSAFFFPFR